MKQKGNETGHTYRITSSINGSGGGGGGKWRHTCQHVIFNQQKTIKQVVLKS